MGGLFSAPKMPTAPQSEPVKDPEEEARKHRLKEIERRRRGRAGTVATSPRGLLALRDGGAEKKSLFGE